MTYITSRRWGGGRFAMQRGKSGPHRAGTPSGIEGCRGLYAAERKAQQKVNRLIRQVRVKRRGKSPHPAGVIPQERQARPGARPNRE